MYLLVDAQLPIRLAEWLRAKGLTAAHIDEVGLTGADDHRIWQYAAQISELPSIIVTKAMTSFSSKGRAQTTCGSSGFALEIVAIVNSLKRLSGHFHRYYQGYSLERE